MFHERVPADRFHIHGTRLAIGIACIIFSITGLVIAWLNVDTIPFMPRPGPAPRQSLDDPEYLRERAWRDEGQQRVKLGFCGGMPIGLVGLVLVASSIRRERRSH